MVSSSARASSIQRFRKALSQGMVVGTFSKSQDPAFIEIMGHAGFDFVVLDLEHGPNTRAVPPEPHQGRRGNGSLPDRARQAQYPVPYFRGAGRGRRRDSGPEHRQQGGRGGRGARGAFRSPGHERGVPIRPRRRLFFARPLRRTLPGEHDVIVLQLEGVEAVRNIREILSVPGVDIIFVGPYDLSQSLGVPGDVDNPRVTEAMKTIVR